MAGAAIGVAGSLVGGMMSSDAAGDAAASQSRAAAEATAEQRRQYDLTRQDMEPWRQAGSSALNRLSYLMGIGGTGGPGGILTEAQLREQLLPQFTTTTTTAGTSVPYSPGGGEGNDTSWYDRMMGGQQAGQSTTSVDEAGLNAAIQARMQEQQAAQAAAQGDSAYGSLLRRFTMDDYLEDPGYQFRLNQGEQAINRASAAAGRYDSGRALKDLTEFNSGLASQEFTNAYNRWNNDQSNIFNRLSGVAGTGQQATNQLAAYGANMANNVASNTIQAGNAAAAGRVGSANAWNNALGGATNALAQYFQPSYSVSPSFSMNNGLRSNISNPTYSARF